jgi:hypothetical protein
MAMRVLRAGDRLHGNNLMAGGRVRQPTDQVATVTCVTRAEVA